MSIINKMIDNISPSWGLERRKAQFKLEQFELAKRNYEGASTSKRLKDWIPLNKPGQYPDSGAIDLMASRVSYLYDNSAAVKRGINALSNYIFGPGCVPHAVKANGKKHDVLEGILKDFVDTPACDIEGRETLYSKQNQAGIHVPRDGAFLIQRIWANDKNSPLPFKLKSLSQDHIDKSKSQVGNYGNRIVQGVEYNRRGERVALWINDYLPMQHVSASIKSKRYKMEDFCHPFRTTIAGQVHGITWGAPIIVRAKDFDDYMDAQLIRQKISQCFVGLIHDIEGGLDNEGSKPMEGKIQPGTWMMAPEGKTVEFSQPPMLEGLFEYAKIQHLGIASGLEVPYMIVSSDFSDSNYTQSRMTLLDFARSIECYQQHIFYPQMNYKIGQWIMEAASLRGVNTFNTKLLWVYPRKEFVDPEKDMKAYALAVANGFMSWEMVVREMGHDPDDVAKSLQASKSAIGALIPLMSEQIEENQNGS